MIRVGTLAQGFDFFWSIFFGPFSFSFLSFFRWEQGALLSRLAVRSHTPEEPGARYLVGPAGIRAPSLSSPRPASFCRQPGVVWGEGLPHVGVQGFWRELFEADVWGWAVTRGRDSSRLLPGPIPTAGRVFGSSERKGFVSRSSLMCHETFLCSVIRPFYFVLFVNARNAKKLGPGLAAPAVIFYPRHVSVSGSECCFWGSSGTAGSRAFGGVVCLTWTDCCFLSWCQCGGLVFFCS